MNSDSPFEALALKSENCVDPEELELLLDELDELELEELELDELDVPGSVPPQLTKSAPANRMPVNRYILDFPLR